MSALLAGARLWTLDTRLARAARRFGVAYAWTVGDAAAGE